MADHHFRQELQEVVRRHAECRMAFQDLRSQIKSGLLEASDVFNSLSIPLMKLVGLKAEEMAKDGKSSTIIINPESPTCFTSAPLKSNGLAQGSTVSGGPRGDSDQDERAVSVNRGDEEVVRYSVRAKEACEEISEKQRVNAQSLVYMLHGIGTHLNASQESIHRAIGSSQDALCHFFKRAASFILSLPRTARQPLQAHANQDAIVRLFAKVLQAAYENISSALEGVEQEADTLLRSLAEITCGPMVAHIKEIRADAKGGAPARLWALVEEMEAALGELRVEAAMARKRMRVAEEERAEALRLCWDMKAALMGDAMTGSRKRQPRHSPVSTDASLLIPSCPSERGTNGIDGLNRRNASSTRLVLTRSRRVCSYSTCK